jgi:hypothetical protein
LEVYNQKILELNNMSPRRVLTSKRSNDASDNDSSTKKTKVAPVSTHVIIIKRNSRGTPFFEKVKKIKDVTRTELTGYQFSEMNKKTPPPLQKLLTYAARFPDTTKEKKNPRDWTAEKWSRFLNNTLTTDQEGYGCLEHDIVETCIKLARTRPVLLPGFKHEDIIENNTCISVTLSQANVTPLT